MTLKKLLGFILVWVLGISLVATLSIKEVNFKPSFPYANDLLPQYGSRSLTSWAHFDGVHYLTIIEKGYEGTGLIQAFFPLYPMLVRILSWGSLNPLVVGRVVSILSFILGSYLLHIMIKKRYSQRLADQTLLVYLLFPTSFFFMSLYTEGLFFLLTVLVFYYVQNKQWLYAGISGALAAATRLPGVFLCMYMFLEWYETRTDTRSYKRFLYCMLPLLGVIAYMRYLQATFGDPLLFINVQHQFGAERETSRLVLLYQVFWRYLKMVFTVDISSWLYFNVLQELLAGIIGVVGSIYAFLKLRKSEAVFILLCFITPTLTGTFSSLPRYLLTIVPLFYLFPMILKERFYKLWLLFSGLLLLINIMLFISGRWVA